MCWRRKKKQREDFLFLLICLTSPTSVLLHTNTHSSPYTVVWLFSFKFSFSSFTSRSVLFFGKLWHVLYTCEKIYRKVVNFQWKKKPLVQERKSISHTYNTIIFFWTTSFLHFKISFQVTCSILYSLEGMGVNGYGSFHSISFLFFCCALCIKYNKCFPIHPTDPHILPITCKPSSFRRHVLFLLLNRCLCVFVCFMYIDR